MSATIPFYDTHAHLDDPAFARDLAEVMARAQAAGIRRVVAIGTDLESSRGALALSERFATVYAAVGWHPSHAAEAPSDFRPVLRELARHPKVVALGETGLDYHWLPGAKPGGNAAEDAPIQARQADLFGQHLEIAAELGLPCVIHQRDALEETLALLTPFAPRVRGVFHCFVDSFDAVRRIQALDGLVSFTGIVTFKNAESVRATIAQMPLDRLMLETDSPYLAPAPHRGKRAEPAHVAITAAAIAQARGCSLEELSEATCRTAHDFFQRMPA